MKRYLVVKYSTDFTKYYNLSNIRIYSKNI